MDTCEQEPIGSPHDWWGERVPNPLGKPCLLRTTRGPTVATPKTHTGKSSTDTAPLLCSKTNYPVAATNEG